MDAYRRDVVAEEVHVHAPPAGSGRLRIALLFPSSYAVGMANLAVQTLYGLLNSRGDVRCERVFYPGIPERGRQREGVLRSVDEGTALGAFDVIAITSSFELDWLNVPAALKEGGVPVLSADRPPQAPLVIAGGPAVTANPQPLAPMADALFIGEAEPVINPLLDLLLEHDRSSGAGREAILEGLTEIPGFYVPAFVEQSLPIQRIALRNLDEVPTTTEILSPHSEFPSTFLIETGRGCPRTCRFCLARQIYHPLRMRSAESILRSAGEGLEHTNRIGLVGAAVAEHPKIEQIATQIVAMGGRVSTSSLRTEGVSEELLAALAAGGQRTITLAPETAVEELAETLGKQISYEAIRDTVALAAKHSLTDVRLYFILGIPGETDAAAVAIADFVEALEREVPAIHITVSAGALVPKPHTELQRTAVPGPDEVARRMKILRKQLRSRTRAEVRLASARWGAVQTVLGRGGRELAPVLTAAAGGGPGDFERALLQEQLSLESYLDEQSGPMPWEVVADCLLQDAGQ